MGKQIPPLCMDIASSGEGVVVGHGSSPFAAVLDSRFPLIHGRARHLGVLSNIKVLTDCDYKICLTDLKQVLEPDSWRKTEADRMGKNGSYGWT